MSRPPFCETKDDRSGTPPKPRPASTLRHPQLHPANFFQQPNSFSDPFLYFNSRLERGAGKSADRTRSFSTLACYSNSPLSLAAFPVFSGHPHYVVVATITTLQHHSFSTYSRLTTCTLITTIQTIAEDPLDSCWFGLFNITVLARSTGHLLRAGRLQHTSASTPILHTIQHAPLVIEIAYFLPPSSSPRTPIIILGRTVNRVQVAQPLSGELELFSNSFQCGLHTG